MTAARKLLITCAVLFATATPVLAATHFEDGSTVTVIVFLTLCALIIGAQLIPAALLLIGLVKGLKDSSGSLWGRIGHALSALVHHRQHNA